MSKIAGVSWQGMALLLAVLTLLALGAACAEDADPDEPDVVDHPELVVAIAGEIQGTDPQQVTTTVDLVHTLITTPPVSMGLNNDELLPFGGQDVEISDDGLKMRITFDPERTFHNGVPATAEAWEASVERYIDISPYAFDYDPVEEITIEDDTAVVTLSEPGPGMLVVLSSSYAGAVEAMAAEEMGEEEFDRATIGCGPYKVDEWVDGSHITMVRNDDYFDYLPFVDNNEAFAFDKITVRFIPEGFTRVSEIRAGNVDLITGVPSESLEVLEEDPDVQVHDYLNSNVRYTQMNTKRFPTEDYSVRMAIALALDRDELKDGVDDVIQPVFGLVGPAMVRHHEETELQLQEEYAHDLDRAKQLLENAGWEEGPDGVRVKDGEELTFEFAFSGDNPIDVRAAPIIQSQLDRIGVDLQLREYDGRYLRDLVEERDFDMILSNWSWLDPGGVWPASLREGAALAPWSHPEVEEILDRAVFEPDDDEGARIWGELSERIWEDVPFVPLWSDRLFVATRSNVSGLHMSVSGSMFLHDLDFED